MDKTAAARELHNLYISLTVARTMEAAGIITAAEVQALEEKHRKLKQEMEKEPEDGKEL